MPGSHVAPLQQPAEQEAAVQMHWPWVASPEASHAWPVPHVEQVAPPVPQLLVDVPGSHTLPLQQPVEQEAAVQMHWPSVASPEESQTWPVPQAEQAAPPAPQ